MSEQRKILVVEDDPTIQRILSLALATEGFQPLLSTGVAEAQQLAREHTPDLYLIDIGLPDGDGISLIRELRSWTRKPIIVLTGELNETDKVAALDAGADDYLTKPFGIEELKARIRVALRRLAGPRHSASAPLIQVGSILVDLASRRVSRGGKEIQLTPIEFRLLAVLCSQPGRLITHEALLDAVWGPSYHGETHYLHIYVRRLRSKFRDHEDSREQHIETIARLGYRLLASEVKSTDGKEA
jgi:two-component system KDP operon response regulator KdpE